MPQKIWKLRVHQLGKQFTTDGKTLMSDSGVEVAKLSASGLPSSWGSYPASGSIVTTVPFVAGAVTELIGFKADIVYPVAAVDIASLGILRGEQLGTVSFQASIDGGSNWLYWDGGAWSVPGASDWNTELAFSTNMSSLMPRNNVAIRMKIESEASVSPLVKSLSLFFDTNYDFFEDALRTLRRWLLQYQNIRCRYRKILPSASDNVTVVHPFNLNSAILAFNLTTDPDRQVNIFDHDAGDTVYFTSSQDSGSDIEVVFYGSADTKLAAEPIVNTASLPAFLISIPSSVDAREVSSSHLQREYIGDQTTVRLVSEPPIRFFDVEVHCLAISLLHAQNMASAVVNIFEENFLEKNRLVSLASGEDIAVYNLRPLDSRDDSSTQLFEKVILFTGKALDWSSITTEDAKVVTTPVITTGNFSVEYEQVEVSL